MNERIKNLRKTLGLTQQEFADKIGMKRNTYANYEMDRNEPSASVLALIVRTFNVNETWLRTGEGEMFHKISRDEEIAAFLGDVLRSESDDFRRQFLSVLSRLGTAEWAVLAHFAEMLVEEKNKKD